ncbi:MAG: cyclic nucleotide-binding domain-containing protein [Proteobacteria bacterium]|nr:cyclic nucleotide-binding domain-containing protein [Pseudomonadota bacterium]
MSANDKSPMFPGVGNVPAGRASGQAQVDPQVVDVAGKSTEEILAQIEVFADLPSSHLREIAEIGSEEQFRGGEHIFSEGDAGDKFYLILDGAIRISRTVPGMGEEALAVLRPGTYFGEMSLVDEAPRSADAIVHERCRLFVITRRDLQDLLFVDRDLAYELLWRFVRTLSRRLRATNDKMTFLATTNKF